MKFSLVVDNIKCGGCSSQIEKKLQALVGVKSVKVDVEQGLVSGVLFEDVLENIKDTLSKLGYPESGSQEGLVALGSKAKSFVSCAVGSMGSMNKEK